MPICHTDRGMTLWVSFNRVNKNYLLLISSLFVYMIATLIYRKIIQILGGDTCFFIDYLRDQIKKAQIIKSEPFLYLQECIYLHSLRVKSQVFRFNLESELIEKDIHQH